MAEDRALLKKDLELVLKLDARLHYDNLAEVKYVHQMVTAKKMFVSSLGQRYQKKLEAVLNGNGAAKCMFCEKDCGKETVICPTCMARLQPPVKEQMQEAVKEPEEVVKSAMPKETVPAREQSQREKPVEKSSKEERKSEKSWIWKVILAVVAIVIAFVEGLDMAFSLLMLVSLGVLIYNAVKGKPKKNAAVACVVFFVLTGVCGMLKGENEEPAGNNDIVVGGNTSNRVEKEQDDVTRDIERFLLEYDEAMVQIAHEISPEVEFYVDLELSEENELRKTYRVVILDVDCGAIQFTRNSEKDTEWDSIGAYSSRRDSMGVIVMEAVLRVMGPDMSLEEMESFLLEVEITDENQEYSIFGDYAYAFINDANGLMLLVGQKDVYLNNLAKQNGDY